MSKENFNPMEIITFIDQEYINNGIALDKAYEKIAFLEKHSKLLYDKLQKAQDELDSYTLQHLMDYLDV